MRTKVDQEAKQRYYLANKKVRRKERGSIMRDLRKARGFSQQTIADFLTCSRARIVRIELGDCEFDPGEYELLAVRYGILFEDLRQLLFKGLYEDLYRDAHSEK